MMSNDCERATDWLLDLGDAPDSEAKRLMLFRLQAAMAFEGADYVTRAVTEFPDVIPAFIDKLPQDAKDKCALILGSIDSKSPHYLGSWLGRRRNTTFHYPRPSSDKAAAGKEDVQKPLREAAATEGTVGWPPLRYWFADTVAARWYPAEQSALREVLLAIPSFAEQAFIAYKETRPDGTFTPVAADNPQTGHG